MLSSSSPVPCDMRSVPDKRAARAAVKALLKVVSPEDLATQSVEICERVLKMPVFTAASVIAGYLTCLKLREVDTGLIIAHALARDVKLFVPVVADKDSNMRFLHLDSLACVRQVPPFGIQEPSDTYTDGTPRQELLQGGCQEVPDIVVMPGLGFDRSGRRLGRGGGYYDKFLSKLLAHATNVGRPRPSLVALCFKEQLLNAVPVDAHDENVDWLVTPDEIIDCRTHV